MSLPIYCDVSISSENDYKQHQELIKSKRPPSETGPAFVSKKKTWIHSISNSPAIKIKYP